MKTLIFKNADNSINVQIRADIFATVAQLQQPGFDTRFTNMEIQDSDVAIAAGVNFQEMENSWQGAIALANSLSGIGLFLFDINGSGNEIEIVAIS